MALGLGVHEFHATITTDTTTALLGAPGASKRIYIRELTVDIETSKASGKLVIQDGDGKEIATLDCSDDNNRIERAYHLSPPSKGRQCGVNVALNAVSANIASGGEVHVNGSAEVVGGT